MKNIKYKTKEISAHFSSYRTKWDDFYSSEKWVLEKIAGTRADFGNVLDIGCACGGLGSALAERYSLDSYTGIDINNEAIEVAKNALKLSVPTELIAGDVLEINMGNKKYDTVFSLSCADWNIETNKIISAAWEKVKPGGYFIISLRLTNEQGVNDINKSYQYINPTGNDTDPEIANYVVFNGKDILAAMARLSPAPEVIGAYGYWGKPSSTAVTLFKKLAFTVFYIKKSENDQDKNVRIDLNLPLDVIL
ncbi:MAG: class I SAM-dependent methyltransferase [Pseudomonadota bacterium]